MAWRCPFIRVEATHAFDVNIVVAGFLSQLLYSSERALSQNVSQTLPFGNPVHHFIHHLLITPLQFQTISHPVIDDPLLIEFYRPGDHAAELQGVDTILVDQIVADKSSFHSPAIDLRGKGRQRAPFRSFHVLPFVSTFRNYISVATGNGAAETASHPYRVLEHVRGIQTLPVRDLIALKVPVPHAADHVRCIVPRRSAQAGELSHRWAVP